MIKSLFSMLKYFLLLSFPFTSLFGQKDFSLYFTQNATATEKYSHLLLYEYQSWELNIFNKKYRVELPEHLRNTQTAFGFIDFGGSKNDGLEGNTLVVVEKYLFGKPTIYIDYNHNLNLRDDASPYTFENLRDTMRLTLFNTQKTGATVSYKLFYPQYESPQVAKQVETSLSKTGAGRDNKVLPVQYWLSYLAENSLIKDTILDSVNILIGLYDADKNGLYNDAGDRIMIGDFATKKISPSISDGAVEYGTETVIRLNNKSYKVLEIEEKGKYIRLQQTEDNALRMFEGEPVIDFPFKRVDAPTTTLYEQLSADKYTVIYFWGLWCKNCLNYSKKLASLSTRYSSKLQVIGMNVGDHTDNIRKHFYTYNLNWVNGIATKDILSIFLTDTYPTCVLISPDKKILRFNANMEDIESYLQH